MTGIKEYKSKILSFLSASDVLILAILAIVATPFVIMVTLVLSPLLITKALFCRGTTCGDERYRMMWKNYYQSQRAQSSEALAEAFGESERLLFNRNDHRQ